METTPLSCPLCLSKGSSKHFFRDKYRDYYRCSVCNLTHIAPSSLPSLAAEKREYDKHQNSQNDAGYRKFLSRLFIPVNKQLPSGSHGLDFGSGPGPVLSLMFEEAGHHVSLYDPFYAPDKESLGKLYDFVTASEVVEHFHYPERSLSLLWSLVTSGGWLGIMTKLALDREAFSTWHYKNDPTHVCFFSKTTMEWLAGKWQAEVLFVGSDVCLFRKPKLIS